MILRSAKLSPKLSTYRWDTLYLQCSLRRPQSIPVLIIFIICLQVDVTAGKFAFGNKTLPTSLVVSVEGARCTYSTKPAVCALDHFMHFVVCKAENFKILLAPSPKYTGLRDEAPRFMGEGLFIIFLFRFKKGLTAPNKQKNS